MIIAGSNMDTSPLEWHPLLRCRPTIYMCTRSYLPNLFQSPCDQVSALLGDHVCLNNPRRRLVQ
ncbi:uncharacterized protein LACBIDRAFT_300628 [Laccaria bicolor S238N-H82]|uniref:Predicted protein n=1 Tax=Laccaria bicolor (strain S238N-H82 / ATCC MYA-4686) TaxID=486041 RepID=B0CPR4_LACBS|nr:uncharacterized protein LACBIDRAFT_300628 [Laccaria bicolor S238N-H82]EDR14976.1 predicted protein [Laccaria bicolor S238N-H82]|eukprot:XP_001873184.1 predicted protein [Laccaria bicolor S238N-H82]